MRCEVGKFSPFPSPHSCNEWRGGVRGGGRFLFPSTTPHPRPLPAASRGEGSGEAVPYIAKSKVLVEEDKPKVLVVETKFHVLIVEEETSVR